MKDISKTSVKQVVIIFSIIYVLFISFLIYGIVISNISAIIMSATVIVVFSYEFIKQIIVLISYKNIDKSQAGVGKVIKFEKMYQTFAVVIEYENETYTSKYQFRYWFVEDLLNEKVSFVLDKNDHAIIIDEVK